MFCFDLLMSEEVGRLNDDASEQRQLNGFT